MALTVKVNIRKGWPNASIVDTVLPPASGVTVEAGFIGYRNHLDPEGWALGITTQFQEAYVFMNDSLDPDSNRGATSEDYIQMGIGGVRGISLANPLEIETIQWKTWGGGNTPSAGDLLYADTDGKLAVGALADGTVVADNKVVVGIVHRGPFMIGTSTYVSWAPVAARLLTDAGSSGPDNA
jgi:hypothetical protein